ncbi:hypothetical protein [Streptomyces varsoviensis]|uniref:hypothetical protein n=1 Tax=Streptomyces varsoviensis TaxID=67373 RepID=UPI0012FF3883|nr:hypothetical protein [Streptomyces varsoviensis]
MTTERRLTRVLADEAEALGPKAAGHSDPPVVLLARARRAFAVAGLVSMVLAEHGVPARDAYDLGGILADAACTVLDPVVGPELVAAHRADLRRGEAQQLAQLAEFDITFNARIGEPAIDDTMVTLLTGLSDLLAGVAADERAIPEQRRAARIADAQARELWTHYGGDSGGW